MKSKNLSENILRSVKSKGFKYIDLPSVIEANHIVQRSGENFRKFIFSFTDQNGSELCLRPDLTIASCLRYLENNLKGKEKIFYSGQAYRKSQNKKDSIIRNQIGFEILGSKDEKNDDKEIINTSLKSLQNIKYSSGILTIGNVEIFNLLISKLDIPKRWKLRLSRHFWREEYFNDLLKRLETNFSPLLKTRIKMATLYHRNYFVWHAITAAIVAKAARVLGLAYSLKVL